jgi:hypothetical protein
VFDLDHDKQDRFLLELLVQTLSVEPVVFHPVLDSKDKCSAVYPVQLPNLGSEDRVHPD